MGNVRNKKPLQALLVVISAPSGGGNTTVIQKILKRNPGFRRSLSVTTRRQRRGEKEGRDYFFVAEGIFQSMINRQSFVEWAEVHGNLYGTPKRFVEEGIRNKWVMLFSLDVQGALAIKKKYPQAVLIFLLPPSWEELKKRLFGRKSDSTETLSLRLKNARRELKKAQKYDYQVVNSDLKKTVAQVEKI